MTTTILNLGDSIDVDVAEIKAAPMALFGLADTAVPDDNTVEATYRKFAGSKEYPMATRVGRYVNPKSNDGIGLTNTSVKVSTFVQETDAEDNVIWTYPGHVVIALSMPGMSGIPNEAQILELIGNAFTFLVPVVTGAVSTAAIDELKFGLVNGLLDHASSASS
jgi:hypothetical protein